jgi:CubicO group peptidase (beta-lactamase class C family)
MDIGARLAVLLVVVAVLVPSGLPGILAQDGASDRVQMALGQLDALADQTLSRTGVPGMAIGVVYRDQPVYLRGFGVRDTGTGELVDPDTVFQLASVSKPIASTVVASLVGDGVVSWDDRIVDHLPDFALLDPWITREISLRDMFAHRSGLPHHAGDLLEDMGYGREEVLHRLRYQHPDSSFRSTYAYTNFGLTAAGVAAARAAGKSWEDVSVERLYQPLGMTSTSSRHVDLVAAQNRARGHVLVADRWVALYDRDPDAQSPAGGVSSTVRDMTQWMRLHLREGMLDGRQIVAVEPLRETHRPQIVSTIPPNPATDRASFYGLGWNVSYDDAGRVRLGHSGAFALGAGTNVSLAPSADLGIVVLTNAAPVGAAEAVATSFLDLALTGAVQRDWLDFLTPIFAELAEPAYGVGADYSQAPAPRSAARPTAAYLGTYGNVLYGEIEIAANDPEGLVLRQGPMKNAFALTHWDGDVFLYQPEGENAGGLSQVTFAIDPDQRAASVAIENLNVHGEGTFARLEAPE